MCIPVLTSVVLIRTETHTHTHLSVWSVHSRWTTVSLYLIFTAHQSNLFDNTQLISKDYSVIYFIELSSHISNHLYQQIICLAGWPLIYLYPINMWVFVWDQEITELRQLFEVNLNVLSGLLIGLACGFTSSMRIKVATSVCGYVYIDALILLFAFMLCFHLMIRLTLLCLFW